MMYQNIMNIEIKAAIFSYKHNLNTKKVEKKKVFNKKGSKRNVLSNKPL